MRNKKTKRNKRSKAVTDDTPTSAMIDIVFLLLIYFITTQRPIIEDTLLSFSPSVKGGTGTAEIQNDFVTLEITDKTDEYCLMNGQAVSISKLSEWLINVSKNDPQTRIILFCNDNVKHYKLVEILDICRQSPLQKISIVTK